MATNTALSAKYMNGMDASALKGHAVWFDQHRNTTIRGADGSLIFEEGRPYWSAIELKTRMPSGQVYRLGWTAPFYVPQQYLLDSIGKTVGMNSSIGEGLQFAGVTTNRIRINYDRMKGDDEQAFLAHWRLAVEVATEKGWEVPMYGAKMDRRLLQIVGSAPRSPKIAEALQAGNPWLLGQLKPTFDPTTGTERVEEDEQLSRLLTLNRPDLLTPEQAEREYGSATPAMDGDMLSEAMKLLAEAKKELAELKAAKAKPRGRPPKTAPVGV